MEPQIIWFGWNERWEEYEVHYSDGIVRDIDGTRIIGAEI